ncbi:MAG: TolC family protein [Myxococcales bacterium]|nr:TolC family protein [Deltaproteobacteria bacterium]NND30160.1 TolC family protein [Myxococcales bacterium]
MRDKQLWFVLRTGLLAAALGSLLSVWTAQSTGAQEPSAPPAWEAGPEVTVDDALRSAFERHPDLRAAHALVEEARGRLLGAKTYPFNPQVLGLAGSRTGVVDRSVDLAFEVGQQVQIAGQRPRSKRAAEAGVTAEQARWERSARLLAAQVHVAFINAVEARRLLEITEADVELTRNLSSLAKRRLERGATTQLEVNLATIEFGRSQGRAMLAEGIQRAARAELAQTMAVDPAAPPTPIGDLDVPSEPPSPLDELVTGALENRADLEAFRELERRSEARVRLARSQGAPNVTVRGFWAREGPENIVGGGGTISVPVFQRNQGPIAQSKAAVSRTRAERESLELTVAQETAATYARHAAASATAKRLQEAVLGSLQQNLDLLQKAFEAGKTTWPEVLIIRRSLIDARRELVSAQAEARRAWIWLQLAAGQMPVLQLTQEQSQ